MRIFRELFAPLELALQHPSHLTVFIEKLGWRVDDLLDDSGALEEVTKLKAPLTTLSGLVADIESGEGDPATIVLEAFDLVDEIFAAVEGLKNPPTVAHLAAPFNDPQLWKDAAIAVPEVLLHDWLMKCQPVVYRLVDLAGAVKTTATSGGLTRRGVDLAAAWRLLSDPLTQLATTYGWGTELQHTALLERLLRLALVVDLPARLSPLRSSLGDALFGGAGASSVSELLVPLHEGFIADNSRSFALSAMLVPAPLDSSTSATPDGLFLTTELIGSAEGTIDLGSGWTLEMNAAADASGAIGVFLHPSGAKIRGVAPSIDAKIALSGKPETPWVLVGDPDGMRLQLSSFRAGLSATGTVTNPEVVVEVGIGDSPTSGLDLVIDPGEGDGFLKSVLGDSPITVSAGLSGRWSSKSGLTVDGSAGFEIVKRIDKAIGPLQVDQLRLRLGIGTTGFEAIASVTAGIVIGPITAVVDDVGLRFSVLEAATPGRGTFGPVDVELALKHPEGLGLSVDVGELVKGGGYLEHDKAAGRYAGVAQLKLAEALGLTATGILMTKMPDGSDGWSLFLSLGIDLPYIALPFGFTLNGVGGLVGINRSLDADALGDAVRSGSLDAVLFPEDPIRDAALIISEIDAIFPPAQGQYVFGPMVTIGWCGTLIELELAVVIQVPSLKIALLGELNIVKPNKKAPALVIKLAFAGVADFVAGTISADASLTGSKLLQYQLTGDAAYRQATKTDPFFLLSVGGFHPRFVPATPVPPLQRVGITFDTGDKLQIQLGSYFAVASNTVQFGASITLWAKALGFTIEGGASFDALIHVAPFGFEIDVEVFVTVSAGQIELLGVRLEASLDGPKPIHIKGIATFKFLGAEKEFHVDETIGGSAEPEELETADIMGELRNALSADAAWNESKSASAPVSFLEANLPDGAWAVSPSSSIEVRQRVVPLGHHLDKFGAMLVGPTDLFEMTPVLGGVVQSEKQSVTDSFAAAQFFDRSDAEKLSAPSFELFDSGVVFSASNDLVANAKDYELGYEEILVDELKGEAGKPIKGRPKTSGFARDIARARKTPARFALAEERFIVTRKDDLGGDATVPTTYAAAKHLLESKADKADYQIVPWSAVASGSGNSNGGAP